MRCFNSWRITSSPCILQQLPLFAEKHDEITRVHRLHVWSTSMHCLTVLLTQPICTDCPDIDSLSHVTADWQPLSELHAGPNFATRPGKGVTQPDPLKFTSSWTRPDPTRPAGLSIKRKNHKTSCFIHDMTLFQTLVLTRVPYTTAAVVTDYWLTQHATKKLKGFYSVLIQSRPHVSYISPTDEKSLSDCAELAGMLHRSVWAVSDIMVCRHRVLLPELQWVAET